MKKRSGGNEEELGWVARVRYLAMVQSGERSRGVEEEKTCRVQVALSEYLRCLPLERRDRIRIPSWRASPSRDREPSGPQPEKEFERIPASLRPAEVGRQQIEYRSYGMVTQMQPSQIDSMASSRRDLGANEEEKDGLPGLELQVKRRYVREFEDAGVVVRRRGADIGSGASLEFQVRPRAKSEITDRRPKAQNYIVERRRKKEKETPQVLIYPASYLNPKALDARQENGSGSESFPLKKKKDLAISMVQRGEKKKIKTCHGVRRPD
ncbi:hypothetical protein FB451DRAFT_1170092 [Mycena latifolia]|nr:hypothetical protein FB451DRAFT_1170092 [Mycena latifolia]